jgi:two-component system cell cycle sensor histidine kinase PleC
MVKSLKPVQLFQPETGINGGLSMLEPYTPQTIKTPVMLPVTPEDTALFLANMGRWHWIMGQKDVAFSPNVYDIFELDSERFTPSLQILRSLVSTRDMSKLFIVINKMLGDNRETVIDFTLKHPGRANVEFFVRCFICPEMDDSGEIVALHGIIQDITREKRNHAALQNALEETEASNRAKSRFLATMSHELRTPLNAIIGFSEMMHAELLGPLGNKRYIDYAGSINESGRYLLDLINDILDMSKIEAGKYELVHEPVNVAKAIRLACHMVENSVKEKNLNLIFKTYNETAVIEADRRAFMQIMLNLLSNAVKFTDEGGTVNISITDQSEHRIMIAVADTGIGIPADKLNRIGQPFEQVSSAMARGHNGTGLGLAITKKLVEMHDGELKIASVFGQGTTVSVTLPAMMNQKQYDLFNGGKRPPHHFDGEL